MDERAFHALMTSAMADPELQLFQDPGMANGSCGLAVDRFLDLLDEHEIAGGYEVHFRARDNITFRRSDLYAYEDAPHGWYLGGCEHPGHIVAVLGGWVVDWTARQFVPDAPWPLVFRLDGVRT